MDQVGSFWGNLLWFRRRMSRWFGLEVQNYKKEDPTGLMRRYVCFHQGASSCTYRIRGLAYKWSNPHYLSSYCHRNLIKVVWNWSHWEIDAIADHDYSGVECRVLLYCRFRWGGYFFFIIQERATAPKSTRPKRTRMSLSTRRSTAFEVQKSPIQPVPTMLVQESEAPQLL